MAYMNSNNLGHVREEAESLLPVKEELNLREKNSTGKIKEKAVIPFESFITHQSCCGVSKETD